LVARAVRRFLYAVRRPAFACNRLKKITVMPVRMSKSATFNGPAGLLPVAGRISAPEATVIVYVAVASGAVPLLAVTVKVNDPLVVGVPEITSVFASSWRPAGSEPVVTVNVGAGVPVAVIVYVYGVPTVAEGGAAELISGLVEIVPEVVLQPVGTVI